MKIFFSKIKLVIYISSDSLKAITFGDNLRFFIINILVLTMIFRCLDFYFCIPMHYRLAV